MSVKIICNQKEDRFEIAQEDFPKINPQNLPKVEQYLADLNKINEKKKITGCPIWLFGLLIFLSFSTIFLLFISAYLILVAVGFLCLFFIILGIDISIRWNFKKSVMLITQEHRLKMTLIYTIRTYLTGNPISVVLVPIGVIKVKGKNMLEEDIPIYTYETPIKEKQDQLESHSTENMISIQEPSENHELENSAKTYQVPVFNLETSFSKVNEPMSSGAQKKEE